MNIFIKIHNNLATLDDQKEALKNPESAYLFAGLNIPGTDIEKCQKESCKESFLAISFAEFITGANIEYCQEHACKDLWCAYWFALCVPGANIEYCRKACESDQILLKSFDQMIAEKVLL